MSEHYAEIDNTLSDLSDNDAVDHDGGELPLFPSPVEILPEATDAQHQSMGEFIKAPSREGWLELVEMMRVQREQQLMEFYNEGDEPPVVDVGIGLSRLRGNDCSPSRAGRPDPPIEEEDDNMGGWTMHAKEKMVHYEEEDEDEEEVSMLKQSHAHDRHDSPDDIEVTSVGVTSNPSPRQWLMKQSTYCIFILGFAIGTVVIVGLSFAFDRTPSQEIKYLDGLRIRGRGVDHGNNTDTTNKVEQLMADFCDSCQWKGQPFNCAQRVKWEMNEYNLTRDEAIITNLNHCLKPSNITDTTP